ncbi:MAG: GTPase RsgA, partial [Paludibacteraceae bacterium]|nr:GTPase RsgA [Paludibacteraceae bacterium]
MRGLVIKSTGSSYIVLMDDGTSAECHIKGNFRIRGIRSTNPVAVGDFVQVQTLPDGTNWIVEIQERRNYIIRRSTNLSKESHILAANIDQVALIVTVNHPVTSTTFIDRFLATCEAYRVRALLIFNKIDLFSEEELTQVEELRALYESIGYETVELSAISLQSSEITPLLAGKTTLLSGNSGVGK